MRVCIAAQLKRDERPLRRTAKVVVATEGARLLVCALPLGALRHRANLRKCGAREQHDRHDSC
jgi:hypothetical protein